MPNMHNRDRPARPIFHESSTGLTKREEFTKAALQGLLANPGRCSPHNATPQAVANAMGKAAVLFADAALTELGAPRGL